MDSRLTCIKLFSIFICVSASAVAESLPDESGRYLTDILYGNQWRLGRYCDDNRDVKARLASDLDIQSLYNGSYLDNISTTPDWSSALERLDEANLVGAQSRQELSIVCSINSWGYADKLAEDLSNEPHENASDCLSQLDKFYAFVEKLVLITRHHQRPSTQYSNCNKLSGSPLCSSTDEAGPHLDNPIGSATNFSLNYWLQFNSFGRMPSGRPSSSNLLIGDYDACTRLDSSRYCLGAYDKPSRQTDDKRGASSVVYPFRVGLCLPKSCASRMLTQSARHMRMIDSIVKDNLLEIIDFKPSDGGRENFDRYHLSDLYCPPTGDSLYVKDGRDFLTQALRVYLPLVWLTMLLLGTVYPFIETRRGSSAFRRGKFYRNFIEPFDLRQNWKMFTNSAHTDPRLIGLNGTKVVAMNWLILTHIAITLYPYLNDISKLRSAASLHGAFILQGQHGVPIFFIISGLLVGFKHLRRDNIDLKSMLIARYLRLVPMYLIVYAYVKKIGHLIGDGPLWDYGVSKQSEARQCMNESWLVPILMLANFTPPFAHCVITGWHIANDFQIYFILPLLLRAYKYSRIYGTLLVGLVFMLTHLTHAWFWGTADSYNFQQVAIEPFLFGPRVVLDRLALDYVNPLGRVGTYFLGVLVADWLLLSGGRGATGQCQGVVKKRVTFKSRDYNNNNNKLSWGSGIFLLNNNNNNNGATNGSNSNRTPTSMNHSSRKFNHNQADTQLSSGGPQEGYNLDESGQSNLNKSSPLSATTATTTNATTLNNLNNEESLPYGTSDSNSRASNCNVLYKLFSSSFKANTMVLMGMCLSYGAVFSILLPIPLKLSLGPKLSKAISYPLCRFVLEIGWALLLYCLLRDGQQSSTTTTSHRPATARQTKVKRASMKTKRPDGLTSTTSCEDEDLDGDENEHGQVINSSATAAAAANYSDGPTVAATRTAPTANTAIIGAKLSSSSSPPSSSPSSLPIDVGCSRLGFGGFLLKKPYWNVLVKLNYTLMLTHYTLVRYIVQSQRQLIAFTWANYFQLTAFLLLAAYALSLAVHLTIEMPLTSLTKLLLSKVMAQRRPTV